MRVRLLLLIAGFFFLLKPVHSQTVDETINSLNTLFAKHALGATNFSLKKISDTEIVATNSVTINNYGSEKLTYRFNPKSAVSLTTISSKNNVTFKFSFKENSVIWFDRYMEVERLSKIQCSLTNITPDETNEIIAAYRHLIKSLGGNLKDEIF